MTRGLVHWGVYVLSVNWYKGLCESLKKSFCVFRKMESAFCDTRVLETRFLCFRGPVKFWILSLNTGQIFESSSGKVSILDKNELMK